MQTQLRSLFDRLIHDALLESSPCLNQPLPQLYHIPDWCTVNRFLYHAPDAVIPRTYRSGRLLGHMPGLMN